MFTNVLISSLLFSASVLAQGGTTCGTFPPDVQCLVKSSQYTVLATVVSNTLGQPGSSPTNYNATLSIQCNWATFSEYRSEGVGVQGSQLLVTGFNVGSSRCPKGAISEAVVNTTKIFFIHVATRNPVPGQAIVYSIVDVCVGGITYNPDNLAQIATVLAENPSGAIDAKYRGSADTCKLPTPTATATPSTDNGTGPPLPGNSDYKNVLPMGLLTALFLLTIAFL